MDRQSVYSVSVFQSTAGAGDDTRLQIQEQLVTFILQFRHDNIFVYRFAFLLAFRLDPLLVANILTCMV